MNRLDTAKSNLKDSLALLEAAIDTKLLVSHDELYQNIVKENKKLLEESAILKENNKKNIIEITSLKEEMTFLREELSTAQANLGKEIEEKKQLLKKQKMAREEVNSIVREVKSYMVNK